MADRNKIVERIKKLLNVTTANNATEAEAIAAALAAQKLMAENDVQEWELAGNEGEPIESVSVKRTRQWQNVLARVIADNFRCKFYTTSYQGNMSHRPRPQLQFYGYKSDATAAALTYTHLSKIANRLGNEYCKGLPTYGDFRLSVFNEWAMGFCDGVRTELEKQSQALMIICPPKVNEAFEAMSADFGTSRNAFPVMGAGDTRDKGRQAGRDAVRAGRMESSKSDYMLTGEC